MSSKSISADKSLSFKGGKIKISTLHNKKFQVAAMLISFSTTQKSLIDLLLQKYIADKELSVVGINPATNLYAACSGNGSIALLCPENKIIQNILGVYNYLCKGKLTTQQAKFCKDGDYKKLVNDIKNFEVCITGKCKTFTNNLSNETPKIQRLTTALGAVIPKERESKSGTFDSPKLDIKLDDIGKLYLGIVASDISFVFKGDSIVFPTEKDLCAFQRKWIYKDTFQSHVKSFIVQSGVLGQDKNKNKLILECQNVLAYHIGAIKNFKFSFNESTLKGVNGEKLQVIKSLVK
jgi:hypothetical protein